MQAEKQLRRYKQEVLVKEVQRQRGYPHVVPVAVDQQGFPQKSKLGYRKIGAHRRLPTLFPHYPDPDVRFLYHRDVVATVADSCGVRPTASAFNQAHYLHSIKLRNIR